MRRALFAAMLVAAACKKHEAAPVTTGSAAPVAQDAAVVARPAPLAPLDHAAVDKILADQKLTQDIIVDSSVGATIDWILVARRDAQKQTTGYDLVRIRATDTTTLHLAPPPTASFDDKGAKLTTFDFGEGAPVDALVVVAWTREVKVKDPCDGCFRTTDEDATQLYVVSAMAPQPAVAGTMLLAFNANSQSFPEGNTEGAPPPDEIAYDWAAVASPKAIRLKRTKATIAATRLTGALDPAKDPLLAAGAGKDVPLALP